MINKKQFLGHKPIELGYRDAVHVAIVAVRAGKPLNPGQRCEMNEFGEAVPGSGPGIADPYRSGVIASGESLWLLLNPTEVTTVSHTWEHESVSFAAPTRESSRNKYLEQYADDYGVTYEQLIGACQTIANDKEPPAYPGDKSSDRLDELEEDSSEVWYEWCNESGHEFPDVGTACCPEVQYPEGPLFGAAVVE